MILFEFKNNSFLHHFKKHNGDKDEIEVNRHCNNFFI